MPWSLILDPWTSWSLACLICLHPLLPNLGLIVKVFRGKVSPGKLLKVHCALGRFNYFIVFTQCFNRSSIKCNTYLAFLSPQLKNGCMKIVGTWHLTQVSTHVFNQKQKTVCCFISPLSFALCFVYCCITWSTILSWWIKSVTYVPVQIS